MADKTSSSDAESRSGTAASHPSPSSNNTANKQVKAGSVAVRNWIASVVWLIAVLAALILSVGALLISLDANADNAIVGWVLDAAKTIDWLFWKVFEMNDRTENHLVNWGLAAVSYLIVGRIADRIIRP